MVKLIHLVLCISVIILDRITKALAVILFKAPCAVTNYLSFNTVMNRGVAWGFMNDYFSLQSYVTIVVILIFCLMSYYTVWRSWQQQSIIGELLVLSGGLSNIIDRFYYGGVVDFILLHYGSWDWPIFNLADTAIVCGVLLMI